MKRQRRWIKRRKSSGRVEVNGDPSASTVSAGIARPGRAFSSAADRGMPVQSFLIALSCARGREEPARRVVAGGQISGYLHEISGIMRGVGGGPFRVRTSRSGVSLINAIKVSVESRGAEKWRLIGTMGGNEGYAITGVVRRCLPVAIKVQHVEIFASFIVQNHRVISFYYHRNSCSSARQRYAEPF